MHFNRKKISEPKLRISPRSKKKKRTRKSKKKDIAPVVRSRPKRRNVGIKKTVREVYKYHDKTSYKSLSLWKGILAGHTSFVLGNAPSISKQNLSLLDPYFTIGINRIFYLYDPTILIWQDKELWDSDKKNIMKQKAIRVCAYQAAPKNTFLNFRVANGPFKFKDNLEVLHGKGNSGVLAIQMSIALGCSNIVLLGTDCKYAGKKTNFYGKNKDHKPYTLKMCRTAMKWAKYNCPIPIYNCSENVLWPTQKLKDVIKMIKPKKLNREKYRKIFRK